MDTIEDKVEQLIKKAAEATDKDEAMRFSQAALNAAHAIQVLATVKRDNK